jgi:DNA-binding beta-propeller fold protein YncE
MSHEAPAGRRWRDVQVAHIVTLSFAVALAGIAAVRAAPLAFEHVMDIGSSGTGEDRFAYVQDFAFARDGKFLAMWGRKGSGPGELANPRGIMVDKLTGRVFVADTGNNRIQVFRPLSERSASARAR